MNVVPILGDKFFIYFPIFLLLLCFATIFNFFSKIVNCSTCCKWCGQRFQYDEFVDEEQVEKGRTILFKEREAREKGGLFSNKIQFVSEDDSNKPGVELEASNDAFDDQPDVTIHPISTKPTSTGITGKVLGFFSKSKAEVQSTDIQSVRVDKKPLVSHRTIPSFSSKPTHINVKKPEPTPKKKYAWEEDSDDDDENYFSPDKNV